MKEEGSDTSPESSFAVIRNTKKKVIESKSNNFDVENTKKPLPTKTTWPKDRVVVEIPKRTTTIVQPKQVSFEDKEYKSSTDDESDGEVEEQVQKAFEQPEPKNELELPKSVKVDSTPPKKEKVPAYRRKADIDLLLEEHPQWKEAWSELLPTKLLATNIEWRKNLEKLLRPKNVKTTMQVYSISLKGDDKIPQGSIVVQDPIEQFYNTTRISGPFYIPQAYVAPESVDLRTLWLRINNGIRKECLLDGGSQIASMSLKSVMDLGIAYDPSFTITMESADKGRTTTLGLARNVPVNCEGIIYYLQFHILKDPAYEVLLGRPFETVSQTSLQTTADGQVTATIVDPGNGQRLTLPTYKRGQLPKQYIKTETPVFHPNSRT